MLNRELHRQVKALDQQNKELEAHFMRQVARVSAQAASEVPGRGRGGDGEPAKGWPDVCWPACVHPREKGKPSLDVPASPPHAGRYVPVWGWAFVNVRILCGRRPCSLAGHAASCESHLARV